MKTYNLIQIVHTMFRWALIFGIIETAYFGFNWTPQSTAEIICDTISVSFGLVGIMLDTIGCILHDLAETSK